MRVKVAPFQQTLGLLQNFSSLLFTPALPSVKQSSCTRCVSAALRRERGPLCCHSHLTLHRSPYLKLCHGLALNCHLRFFVFFFYSAQSAAWCEPPSQAFHKTASMSGNAPCFKAPLLAVPSRSFSLFCGVFK